jgi:hypothetical protein
VSLRVDYDERAINQAAAFLDDPRGIRAVLDAIDRLAGSVGTGPVRDHRRRSRDPAHRPPPRELTGLSEIRRSQR